MIPFTDPETQFVLVRHHLDDLVREAGDDRLARSAQSEQPRRPSRWARRKRSPSAS